MEQFPAPLRCSHVSQLNYAAGRTHPLPCRAEAVYLVDDAIHRCADHLTELLVGDPGRSWDITLVATRRDVDANIALTQAGVPCALDRLQTAHATIAARVDLLAAQRDQLAKVLAWLDESPNHVEVLHAKLAALRVQDADAVRRAAQREREDAWLAKHGRASSVPAFTAAERAEMGMPSVGQVIADLMAAQQPDIDVTLSGQIKEISRSGGGHVWNGVPG